jgi:hypothetical protein
VPLSREEYPDTTDADIMVFWDVTPFDLVGRYRRFMAHAYQNDERQIPETVI